MDTTAKLALPYLLPQQAQKHVTHNEAIRMLDALVQLSVRKLGESDPPAAPTEGDRYALSDAPTGAWAGQAKKIAAFQDGAWAFFEPRIGWIAWDEEVGETLVWDGTDWHPAVSVPSSLAGLAGVGINAAPDITNRLAVKSDAVTLSHDDVTPGSGDVRQNLNKASNGNTAAFLFQNGWSGRAEVGLCGDDMLHIKTSPDGGNWFEAMVIDPATGWIGIGGETAPEGPLHIRRTNMHPINDRADDSSAAAVSMCRKSRGTHDARTALVEGDVPQAFFGQGYDGSAFVGAANLRWIIDGPVSTGNIPTMVEFWTFTSGIGHSKKFEITNGGTARPSADNAYSLGDSSCRWASIWAANGTIQTSDARDKEVTGRIGGQRAAAVVDAIDPVMFRWKVGGNQVRPSSSETEEDEAGNKVPKMEAVPVPGKRQHAGFLAQEVKTALDEIGVDCGVWGLQDSTDPNSRQWLRPDQMIPLLWAALKETRAEIETMRKTGTLGK